MPDPVVTCVECKRTFYAWSFLGVFLPNQTGVCQWCLDPTLDLLRDAPQPEAEQ
jgi:hypothetical protein